ncbi:MAG: tRNA preQ1(34) S-adenosylmethionine ribosyltransferase-isomerase QueA [Nitrospiraceae bacterium]|nr:MAG: tRNA preQ1(34) S-adenosylmethionine ribosyltransferase-isomerase QueA [Nitrospiraceae bacterium]
MKLSDFDYQLSQENIAQHPLPERDSSRLLILDRQAGKLEHRFFRDIIDYFRPGDVLILNDVRVTPVRLYGIKPSGGKAEITLLKELGKNTYEALVKGIHEGEVIIERDITAKVSRLSGTMAKVVFDINSPGTLNTNIKDVINRIGVMPLPPYIKRESTRADREHYQTVYSKKEGAVAAPTAGLHFTEGLLSLIRDKEVEIKTITLYVGYGTFKPVTVTDISEHRMDEEFFEIPEAAAYAVNRAKAEGRRVIAVGTTATRALESAAGAGPCTRPIQGQPQRVAPTKNGVTSGPGTASIFIYPGYRFKIIDALVTNFHQPMSTPVMLASAFAGLELLKDVYTGAQSTGYRFFSYGDAMLIL